MSRPWIIPQDIKDYSDLPEIKERDEKKIKIDIQRAENYVITLTNNKFVDLDTDGNEIPVPEDVKTAVILLSEAYGYNAVLKQKQGVIKSETFDDYSYTRNEIKEISIESLDLPLLLDNYKINESKNAVTMRLSAL